MCYANLPVIVYNQLANLHVEKNTVATISKKGAVGVENDGTVSSCFNDTKYPWFLMISILNIFARLIKNQFYFPY